MKTTQKKVVRFIRHLSSKITSNEILYEFYVKRKIERGLRAVNVNQVKSHDEVKALLSCK